MFLEVTSKHCVWLLQTRVPEEVTVKSSETEVVLVLVVDEEIVSAYKLLENIKKKK